MESKVLMSGGRVTWEHSSKFFSVGNRMPVREELRTNLTETAMDKLVDKSDCFIVKKSYVKKS